MTKVNTLNMKIKDTNSDLALNVLRREQFYKMINGAMWHVKKKHCFYNERRGEYIKTR